MTFTRAPIDTEPYDEFGMLPENAAELGMDGSPTLSARRVDVEVIDGEHVSAIAWGDGDPEVVFLHGGGQNAHTWDSVVLALGRPVLAIDLPGHGRSDRSDSRDYSPWHNAVAVAAALEQLAPRAFGVVGMSLGGVTTIRLAATRPDLVRRAVIVDVTPQVNDPSRERTTAERGSTALISGPPTYDSFEEVVAATVALSPKRTEAAVRRGVRHNLYRRDDGKWAWRYDLFRDHPPDGDGDDRDWSDFTALWEDVSRITVPTLVVQGGDSVFVHQEDRAEFERRLPTTLWEVVPGAGHAVQSDQPRALADLIHEFVLEDPPGRLLGSIVGTPARAPGSVRRTATIDMQWPGGLGTPLHLVGRSRDLMTTDAGDPVVLDAAELWVEIGDNRTIAAIECSPARPGIEQLVGAQGGSYLRTAIDDAVPGERERATPLHVLLDDVAGTSLIAGFAWSRWHPDYAARMRVARGNMGMRKGRIICSGLRPGGWAQTAKEAGHDHDHDIQPAGDISTPDDPWGWHEWPERPPVCMRRHRRIDLRPENGELLVDAFFRDSCWEPDGSEIVLHEYTVEARVDAASGTLVDVRATPRVLPFPECPWAAHHTSQLVGHPVRTFRTDVQETLTEMECCTHLNDMLRCLAEVPILATQL
jgi:pimeloyl-ACP methyl ester carboxylesterase